MYGKLVLPLASLCVQSRCAHLPAWVSSLLALHTPISKVLLGNSCSVVACNCGALLAVCCNRAAIAAGILPPNRPKFLSEILFCSDPTTHV